MSELDALASLAAPHVASMAGNQVANVFHASAKAGYLPGNLLQLLLANMECHSFRRTVKGHQVSILLYSAGLLQESSPRLLALFKDILTNR